MRCHVTPRSAVWLLLVFALVAASTAAAQLDEGLVGYYPFESDVDFIDDATGNGSFGEFKGAERTPNGKFGKGLEFEKGAAAVLALSDFLFFKGDFAIAFWLLPKDLKGADGNRVVYARRQVNIDLLNGVGRMDFRVDGNWTTLPGGAAEAIDTSSHTVVTFGEDDGVAVYRDGIMVADNPNVLIIDAAADQDKVYMGFMFNLNGFVGTLDNLRFNNRAFDPDEVLDLFEFKPELPVSPIGSLTSTWGHSRPASKPPRAPAAPPRIKESEAISDAEFSKSQRPYLLSTRDNGTARSHLPELGRKPRDV